jgi:hypothetical protein
MLKYIIGFTTWIILLIISIAFVYGANKNNKEDLE